MYLTFVLLIIFGMVTVLTYSWRRLQLYVGYKPITP